MDELYVIKVDARCFGCKNFRVMMQFFQATEFGLVSFLLLKMGFRWLVRRHWDDFILNEIIPRPQSHLVREECWHDISSQSHNMGLFVSS